MISSKSNKV